MKPVIGFMQGRLSPRVGDRIQAFPWAHWRAEFPAAERIGIPCMEWTLDEDRIDENPFMTPAGRREIRALSARHGVSIPSLTGDFFMQAPFHRVAGAAREERLAVLRRVLEASADLGLRYVVIPLVDDGRIEDESQEEILREGLLPLAPFLRSEGLQILFESDFPPALLARFLETFPADAFGLNYDTGNSAALGFDTGEETAACGSRIRNVHVKDRLRGGTTVPLGEGAADIPRLVRLLRAGGYEGNWILQTCRSEPGQDVETLCRFRDTLLGCFP